MKKMMTMICVFGMALMFPFVAHAHTEESSDSTSKVTVELNSVEEMRNYPRNPNYSYRFLIVNPRQTRAMCWNCGTQTLVNYHEVDQIGQIGALPCPNDLSRFNDIFSTYANYNSQICTRCDVVESREYIGETYDSICVYDGTFEVRREWGYNSGRDLHQVYDYWQSVI